MNRHRSIALAVTEIESRSIQAKTLACWKPLKNVPAFAPTSCPALNLREWPAVETRPAQNTWSMTVVNADCSHTLPTTVSQLTRYVSSQLVNTYICIPFGFSSHPPITIKCKGAQSNEVNILRGIKWSGLEQTAAPASSMPNVDMHPDGYQYRVACRYQICLGCNANFVWLIVLFCCLFIVIGSRAAIVHIASRPACEECGTQLVLTKPGLCVVGVMVWAHAAHLVATIIRWISYSMYVWFFGCTDSHIHVKQLATAVVLLRQILPQMLWHMCCKDFDQWNFEY